MRAGFAADLAVLMRGGIALVDEAVRQRARQFLVRLVGEILVVPGPLAGHQRMGGVVEIVVPLRRVVWGQALVVAAKAVRLIGFIFQHEMDVAAGIVRIDFPADGFRKLGQDVGLAVVDDRMHGIEAQAVEAVLVSQYRALLMK